ncbi:MAG: hypothetical protein ACOH17_13745 [Cellulomonas sp.]
MEAPPPLQVTRWTTRQVGHHTDERRDVVVVERSFVHLEQWRGLATRHDRLAIIYRATAVLPAVLTW